MPFYLLFEKLLKNSLDDTSITERLENISFYNYLRLLKEIPEIGYQIELNIWLVLNELTFTVIC